MSAPLTRTLRLGAVTAAALASSACAAAFGPMRARTFDEAPYYIGVAPRDGLPLARTRVAFDRHDGLGDDHGTASPAVRRLLAVMDAYLDSLPTAGRALRAAPGQVGKGAPDVYFGCDADVIVDGTTDECPLRDDARDPRNMVRVDQASKGWRRNLAALRDSAGAERVLVITLEFTKIWPTQHGPFDRKEAQLGTGYAVPLPWLTAEDRTLDVLTLTGAIVDREGNVVRAGAEGLLAKRTRLLAGAFGVEELISDRDVDAITRARRADLAGQPLVWQVAVENLVAQLTGSGAVRALATR